MQGLVANSRTRNLAYGGSPHFHRLRMVVTMVIAPRIGAFVLETLTTGMYMEPLDSVRELIQNAVDAILEAEARGVLVAGTGQIEVSIDATSRQLSVRDNGLGISSARAAGSLLNIGMSDKSALYQTGFRGIGRLAAIAYCGTLTFSTSSEGESTATVARLDCEGIRRHLLPLSHEGREVAELLREFTEVRCEDAGSQDHYFTATMDDIRPSAQVLLSSGAMERYLCQHAPVPYDSYSFDFAPRIENWLSNNGLVLPAVRLTLSVGGNRRQIYKPYSNTVRAQRFGDRSQDLPIRDIGFYPEAAGEKSPFWLWYAKTDLRGSLRDSSVAGFRFRKNNFQIGGPALAAQIFGELAVTSSRFNSWHVGEVHVQDPRIFPNARRDGFETGEEWLAVKSEVRSFFRGLTREIQRTSRFRNISLVPRPTTVPDRDLERNSGDYATELGDPMLRRVMDVLRDVLDTASYDKARAALLAAFDFSSKED